MRCSVRTLLLAVAALAVLLGAVLAVRRRADQLVRTAAYHLQAHWDLVDQAGGPLECVQAEEGEEIEDALERIFAEMGGREYLVYRASRYHWEQFQRYREAASRPWLPVGPDPPAPEMANPSVRPDPSFEQRVRDWDKRSSGFQ